MNDEPKALLDEAIEKWGQICDGTDYDYGAENCPLCYRFIGRTGVADGIDGITVVFESCFGCPVAFDTMQEGCDRTPWIVWFEYYVASGPHNKISQGFKPFDTRSQRLAEAELDYLKSLKQRMKDA